MNYETYKALFDTLKSSNEAPYDDAYYQNYLVMNQRRFQRAEKNFQLSEALLSEIKSISKAEKWVVISEPWCGDAAHLLPVIHNISLQNSLIEFDIELRDVTPFRIEQFLANGTKSIPVFIRYDEKMNYISHWGSRPKVLSDLIADMKSKGAVKEEFVAFAQNWYHHHLVESMNLEMQEFFKSTVLATQ